MLFLRVGKTFLQSFARLGRILTGTVLRPAPHINPKGAKTYMLSTLKLLFALLGGEGFSQVLLLILKSLFS